MTNHPNIQIKVPTGRFKVTAWGVVYEPTVPGPWFLPTSTAKEVFDAALRAIEAVAEVEGHTETALRGEARYGVPGQDGGGSGGGLTASSPVPVCGGPTEPPPSDTCDCGSNDVCACGAPV